MSSMPGFSPHPLHLTCLTVSHTHLPSTSALQQSAPPGRALPCRHPPGCRCRARLGGAGRPRRRCLPHHRARGLGECVAGEACLQLEHQKQRAAWLVPMTVLAAHVPTRAARPSACLQAATAGSITYDQLQSMTYKVGEQLGPQRQQPDPRRLWAWGAGFASTGAAPTCSGAEP